MAQKKGGKVKIKVKQSAKLVPKGTMKNDTIKRMQARPPADVAPVFKVKIRRKK